MRINQYVAQATGLSRRAVDTLIAAGRIRLNGEIARLGTSVQDQDRVTLDNTAITPAVNTITIMLNKPAGYVVSRSGQGSPTVYDLLPPNLHYLKPVGRLDKDSSGLLLLTNDGQLTQQLTHPSFAKQKVYEVELDKPLLPNDKVAVEKGIELDDGLSRLMLEGDGRQWTVIMHEGRNRQIRRTFAALGYKVTKLHRTRFGEYKLGSLKAGEHRSIHSAPKQM